MSSELVTISEGDLLSVPGWRGAAVSTGVKPSGKLDLALLQAPAPAPVAGMFTTNQAAAAPVKLCQRMLAKAAEARCVVINSGNANALTGNDGDAHATAMADAVNQRCGGPTLVLSTGVIGVPLPVHKVVKGIGAAATRLRTGEPTVAEAILTTDTCKKTAAIRVLCDSGRSFVVGGMAKGSGMIHPNLATMLALIATDAPIEQDTLRRVLRRAVDRSFHEITVDGDTSTNDSVLLFSQRLDGTAHLSEHELAAVTQGITEVARRLAGMIIQDGEGATRIMQIDVGGACTEAQARQVARAIACSSLVKTALAGGDPNWGRIISAAGTAGVPIEPQRLTLQLGDQVVFRQGCPQPVNDHRLDDVFQAPRVSIHLELGAGEATSRMLTTDLSKRYVEINSEYTT